MRSGEPKEFLPRVGLLVLCLFCIKTSTNALVSILTYFAYSLKRSLILFFSSVFIFA